MACYIREHNVIYLAAPGTASTSLEHMFIEQLGAIYLEADPAYFRYGTRHALIPELIPLFDEKLGTLTGTAAIDFSSARIVTSVRNPYDLHFSEWHRNRTKWIDLLLEGSSWLYRQPDKMREIVMALKLDFSDWVELYLGARFEQQVCEHINVDFVEWAHFHIRMEHIEQDLHDVFRAMGIANTVTCPQLNTTAASKTEYWRSYTLRAREIVYFVNRPTLEKFGYTF